MLDAGVTLASVEVSRANSLFDVRIAAQDTERKRFAIELRTTAQTDERARELTETKVSIMAITTLGTALPPVEFPICFNVKHDLDITPRTVFLGAHATGSAPSCDIKLASSRNAPFAVEHVEHPSPSVSVTRSDDTSFAVGFKRLNRGLNRGEVAFRVRDSVESSPYEIIVPVISVGIDE
jgi:hypothetical protein